MMLNALVGIHFRWRAPCFAKKCNNKIVFGLFGQQIEPQEIENLRVRTKILVRRS